MTDTVETIQDAMQRRQSYLHYDSYTYSEKFNDFLRIALFILENENAKNAENILNIQIFQIKYNIEEIDQIKREIILFIQQQFELSKKKWEEISSEENEDIRKIQAYEFKKSYEKNIVPFVDIFKYWAPDLSSSIKDFQKGNNNFEVKIRESKDAVEDPSPKDSLSPKSSSVPVVIYPNYQNFTDDGQLIGSIIDHGPLGPWFSRHYRNDPHTDAVENLVVKRDHDLQESKHNFDRLSAEYSNKLNALKMRREDSLKQRSKALKVGKGLGTISTLSFAGAGGVAIAAAVGVANIWNPVGWIIMGGLAVVGLGTLIAGAFQARKVSKTEDEITLIDKQIKETEEKMQKAEEDHKQENEKINRAFDEKKSKLKIDQEQEITVDEQKRSSSLQISDKLRQVKNSKPKTIPRINPYRRIRFTPLEDNDQILGTSFETNSKENQNNTTAIITMKYAMIDQIQNLLLEANEQINKILDEAKLQKSGTTTLDLNNLISNYIVLFQASSNIEGLEWCYKFLILNDLNKFASVCENKPDHENLQNVVSALNNNQYDHAKSLLNNIFSSDENKKILDKNKLTLLDNIDRVIDIKKPGSRLLPSI